MFIPSRSHRAFTLIEMLVVMAVIALLAAIILSVNGLVQSKAARARAEVEIKALGAGCDSYKADNGSYPQNTAATDVLDPRTNGSPTSYNASSLFLYKELSGDQNASGRLESPAETGKNYLPDYFQPQRLGLDSSKTVGTANWVTYLKDPWGNSYGYSTMGAKADQDFRVKVTTDATATRTTGKGYNTTFDLWSTAGKTTPPGGAATADVTNIWVKNW